MGKLEIEDRTRESIKALQESEIVRRSKDENWSDDLLVKVLKVMGEVHIIPKEIREYNELVGKIGMAEEICYRLDERISQKKFASWLNNSLPKACDRYLYEVMEIKLKEIVERINRLVRYRKDMDIANEVDIPRVFIPPAPGCQNQCRKNAFTSGGVRSSPSSPWSSSSPPSDRPRSSPA